MASSFPLRLAAATMTSLLLACGDGDGRPASVPLAPSPSPSAEDERGSVGVPPPPDEYCRLAGFTIVGSECKFDDGTSCEQWAFYRGECGQAHSYCNQHGGTISTKTEETGSFTSVYAVCELNGKSCKESSFVQTGKCE